MKLVVSIGVFLNRDSTNQKCVYLLSPSSSLRFVSHKGREGHVSETVNIDQVEEMGSHHWMGV
ncbi:hypothetical protein HanPI659440_Chr09g0323881 [Helianthus annuus]|nr:hypothetical protein HanPI659440_Chr09g0323881 [Helianthus annuus]